GAKPELVAAASALHGMGAAGLAAAGRQGSVAPEATLPVIAQLHRGSGGRALSALALQTYADASAAQREALLAGEFFMPCLSAAATGRALEELHLDRCARMEPTWRDGARCAMLMVSRVKPLSSGGSLPLVVGR
ncbi:hypothetical protein TSOC_001412, partial [Tetrabaena socialis]